MSSGQNVDQIHALLKKLRPKYAPAETPTQEDPLRQLLYSFLLWETVSSKADAAMRRIEDSIVDINELRISLLDEVTAMLGERYPNCEERARRLQSTLHSIYLNEHAISLEGLVKMPKKESKKYLAALEGIPQFVAARVTLLSLGGHAIPVDERLLERLVGSGVFEEGVDAAKAASSLERAIKATDGVDAHLTLQAWCDDKNAKIPSVAGTKSRPASRKKTSKKKKSTKAARSSG